MTAHVGYRIRGVLHVHSNFSDGKESLEQVVKTLGNAGMDFITVSDHAEVFNDERMEQYVALCESLSSARLTVIPGLEFALKGGSIHILGYGVKTRVRVPNMELLVDGIHNAGGIAVLAHPPAGSINMIGPVKSTLDGVEVWNTRYDGLLAPRAESFQLLQRMRMSNPKAWAFCGIDLHEIRQARRPIYVELNVRRLAQNEVLQALKAGEFAIHGINTVIPSSGQLTFVQQLSIAVKEPLSRPWARH